MAFNAKTYRMNDYRRRARENLARARDIKARAATGDAYDWEIARIPTLVQYARMENQMANNWRRIRDLSR